MAKGSVRKKGKKWYYRYYVEDASGNLVQKECVGTESKSETEKLLRKAMEEYESKKIVAKTENITLGELLDVWVDEELKVSSLSNNTVTLYLGVVKIMKRHPLSKRKLRTVTSEHMQEYMDYLSFGGTAPNGTEAKPLSIDRIHSFSAVLQRAFRYAVFPKQYISFNPMQYVVIRRPTQEVDLFATEDEDFSQEKTITHQQYNEIIAYLTKKKSSSLLAVQIAYYAGLRIGEVTGLSWDDINLEEQYLTVRRSLSRNNARHKLELGPTKRKKVRIVDFGDTLAEILRKAKKEQHKQRFQYGQLYQRNYYKEVREKNRVYYELYSLDGTQEVPEDYTEISLVCVRQDGMYLGREALDWMCRSIRKHLKGFENFHFHSLRHTYTSNLNQPYALWLYEFRIYLTKSYLVSVYGEKLTALDLAKVQIIRLFETVKGSLRVITLEVTTTEQEKITVSENNVYFFTMNEEEIAYLTEIFGKRNIEFVCEIQPEEEIDEDEEF